MGILAYFVLENTIPVTFSAIHDLTLLIASNPFCLHGLIKYESLFNMRRFRREGGATRVFCNHSR
jgi:hypothetical protein